MLNTICPASFLLLLSWCVLTSADTHTSALETAHAPRAPIDGDNKQQQQHHVPQRRQQRALGDVSSASGFPPSLESKRGSPRFFGKRSDDLDPVTYLAFETRGAPVFLTARNLNNFDTHNIETRGSPRFFGKRGSPRFFGKRNLDNDIQLTARGSPMFFGKRGFPQATDDEDLIDVNTRGSPRFFGKKRGLEDPSVSAAAAELGSEHRVVKRSADSPMFTDKRGAPLFVGKRFIEFRPNKKNWSLNRPYTSLREFKANFRRTDPHFIGKRSNELDQAVSQGVDLPFPFKRGIPRFVGRKRASPRFIGRKRASPLFVGRRRAPMFVGRRSSEPVEPVESPEYSRGFEASGQEAGDGDASYDDNLLQLVAHVSRLLDDAKMVDDKEFLD